ncbi:DEAD-box type RNA helicase [Diatrype stigma]|uniref:DEAD-box type RNA helicase n=1 Tax=Diatrype stigma TaxID=117547 RepID=A0AAN9U9W7_9PEZI
MCCPKISDDDEEDYDDLEEPGEIGVAEKEKRIADGKKRLELLYDCSLIIGLPAGSAPVLSDEFARRSNAFLRACSACVRNWHKGRRPFLKRLSEFYDDTVIAQMADRLNDFDFDRITKGLEEGRQFIIDHNGIVDQRTFTEGGKIEMLIALFEALCCMPYLSLPDNRRHFNYIFEKIQERKILKLAEVLPTMTYFLFDENPTRNKFAVHTWSRQTYIPPEDFEWAVKDNLANAILKVNDMAASLSQIQLFWQGFLYILKALDENLIVHSLRAMNVQPDIYELMLQHMMVNSDRVLALLIRTFCSLLQKSPKAFWGAFGNYSHIAIAEQVFRSPAYKTLLRKSSEQALGEGAEATSWVRPFVESIPTHQKYVVCDSLVRHLLEDGKDPGLPQEGQLACYRAAAETLSSTLTAFASPNYKLTSTTAVQAHETLNLTLRHKDLVIQLAKLPPTGWQQTALSQAGLSAIRSALALDSRIISEEFNAIHLSDSHVQHAVDRNSSGLWDAFLEILVPGANELAKAMLGAVGPLITVEIFRPQKKQTLSPTRAAFNREFQKTAQSVGRMIERLSDFGQAALNQFCSDPATARPLIASLLHGEDPMNEAATAFIKTVADEERRSDAIAKLLSSQFVPVLASFTRAVEEINEKTHLWSPQFHIIRYSRDILDSLCDLSVGLLRSKTLTASERQVLANWWASQWVFLENAFNQTEAWSHLIETEKMKNFCREAMELADALLAQDGLIASALSQGSAQASLDSGDPDSLQAMKDTLEQPRQNCMGLVRMLRLKDLYLVTVIVSVLGKLLRRLAEHSLDVPHKPLTFIRQAIIKNSGGRYDVPTNLNDQQRAELIRALGEDEEDMDDDIQILSIKKAEPKKQTRLDAWSKSAEELSGAPRGQRPTPSSTRDDLRNMLPASSSEKNRSVLDQMRARKSTKQSEKLPPKPDPKITAANIASIKEKRAKEAEEKRKRDAEAIARAKALRAPKPMVAGEGSGLRGLSGVQGKDHAPQKSEIMVHSSSEDEDDSDEDAAYLAQTAKKRGDDSKRIGPMKLTRGPVKKTKIQRSAKDMRARLIPPMDVLHQAILEWDIFHKGNDPPNGVTCSKVSDTYADPREYKQTFLPLLIYEAWRSFVTAKDESTNKPFDIKVVNRMSVDKFVEVSTAMPIAQKKDNFLSEGDIVLLSTANKPLEVPDEPHCLARIWRTQFKNGTFEISYRISGRAGPILAVLMPQAELFAVKITNMITIEREYASLESLQYYDLMPEILEAKPSPMLKFSDDAVNKTMQNYHLNQGQAKAILNAKENDAFTLVQGPPGTGKTKTIVAMVGALLTGNFAATTGTAIKRPQAAQGAKPGTTGTTKKLLVCAPSNAAVDELVLRLKAGVKSTTGSFHKINVLRLGKSDAINAGVKDVTLDELIKARVEGTANQNGGPSSRELIHKEAGEIKKEITELRPQLESARASENRELTNRLQRQFDELKRRQQRIGARIDADKDSGITAARENELRRRQIQQEILDSAQVLCATLSGSGHEMFKNLNVEFETVIIDEAAQCVELSALIPLKYGCSKCILVGDPKQLPPTVLSQSAARFGYDQSLFVRMQRNQPDDVHLLDTQYRMHPEISLFPSQEFYERKLLDGDDMRKLRYQPWHQSALLGPYRFFDVKGAQERGHRGQSLVNYEELKVAMQIYERFRTDYPSLDLKGKIGIITPYKAQLYELRDQFSRRYGENIKDEIEFNTTDAFQGRECEIIIFSCVRASPTGGIGFMTDIRRMNVGLTRARSSLWILGDSRALVQGEFWNKLIENAKMRQQYTSGDVLSLLRKPGAKLPPPKFSSPETSNNFKNAGTEHSTSTSTRKVTPLEKPRDEQVDVVMEDAPPIPPPAPSNRQKTQPLPQTYTLLERPGSAYHSGNQTSYSTMNERGETVIQPTSDQRPVIHPSGQKRPREDNDAGKGPKRVASALLPGKRALPSAARPIPRPLDPAAMSVLGIPTTQPTNSSPAIRPPRPSAPHNAPKVRISRAPGKMLLD